MDGAEEVGSRCLVEEDGSVVHFVFEHCLSLVLLGVNLAEKVYLFTAALQDKLSERPNVTRSNVFSG